MAKRVTNRPQWIPAEHVVDVYSVSNCISNDFADYVGYWKHNGYWFFDSPDVIRTLALEQSIDLARTTLFFYEVHEREFNDAESQWRSFKAEPAFTTHVVLPGESTLEGYDVVTFSTGTSAECSPLSCNSLATELETNQHCLLSSLERAQHLLETGRFNRTEPGPYRIFAVYSVRWP